MGGGLGVKAGNPDRAFLFFRRRGGDIREARKENGVAAPAKTRYPIDMNLACEMEASVHVYV
jgi:hypothetical protein